MQSFVVIYRAGNALARVAVEKKIKSLECWAHILGEYWFVKTNRSANDIYNMINPIVGLGGTVVVVAIKRNFGFNDLRNSDFLQKHI